MYKKIFLCVYDIEKNFLEKITFDGEASETTAKPHRSSNYRGGWGSQSTGIAARSAAR